MSLRRIGWSGALAFLLFALPACIDTNFDPPELVKTKRFLAIGASPPEAIFGEDIYFEAYIVDEMAEDLTTQPGIEVRFFVCLSLGEVFSAAGLDSGGELSEDCGEGGADRLVLEPYDGPGTAFLPGEILFDLLTSIPSGGPDMPDPGIPGVDPALFETLQEVIAEVGIPLNLRVEVYENGERILRGVKIFALTTRSGATSNPPPPRFAIDGAFVNARFAADPHRCEPEDGAPITVAAGAEVILAPDENEDRWLEEYPVFDFEGGLLTSRETAFYNWYSTGGAFSNAVTQPPDRDVTWTAPEEPGSYPLIVVVRDGHLGTVWCRVDVTVE